MKKWILIFSLIFGFVFIVSPFSFSPIVKDFDSTGSGKIQTFRIKNENDEPIAIQINMLTRNMSIIGEEINSNASHLFIVYPHQLILEPNDSQSIRVQWNGPVIEDSEQAFRIVAEQLPISFNRENSNKGQLNIVYRYVGSVYVIPDNPYSDLTLESVRTENDHLTLKIKNNGTGHSIMEDLVITLHDGTTSVTLVYEDLQGIAGENILAGISREFTISRPSQLSGETISGEITYKETR